MLGDSQNLVAYIYQYELAKGGAEQIMRTSPCTGKHAVRVHYSTKLAALAYRSQRDLRE